MNNYINKINDGFNPELVNGATFDGVFEIPHVYAPNEKIIPSSMIPFSMRNRSQTHEEFVHFYEHDVNFTDILEDIEYHTAELSEFRGVITPDFSLYRDMPLTHQISNTYFNRAVGYYLQSKGLYVIPNIRWGDERTYTRYFGKNEVPLAFAGVDKRGIVAVGSYGCIKNRENRFYFCEGLAALLDELEPKVVIVYGAMPDDVFSPYKERAIFKHFSDWTSTKRRSA